MLQNIAIAKISPAIIIQHDLPTLSGWLYRRISTVSDFAQTENFGGFFADIFTLLSETSTVDFYWILQFRLGTFLENPT